MMCFLDAFTLCGAALFGTDIPRLLTHDNMTSMFGEESSAWEILGPCLANEHFGWQQDAANATREQQK
jgi:hypothetical protein